MRFKLGINGGWTETREYEAGKVTQFYPYVSVKLASFRTTPASYATGQAACHANQPIACQTPITNDSPAKHWGRFCGLGIPGPENQDAARSAGPIDGLDNLCRYHDGVESWYSESRNGNFDVCIVQYGLVNAKLINYGGGKLEEESSAWKAVWAQMPALKEAVDDYKEDTGSPRCSEEELANPTTDTR